MPEIRLNLRVYENNALVFATEIVGAVELGRQQTGERGALLKYAPGPTAAARVVIAPIDDVKVSRRHALLEALDEGRVRVSNVSAASPILLQDATALAAGAARELTLPCRLTIGSKQITLEPRESRPQAIEGLEPLVVRHPLDLDSGTIRRIAISSGKVVDTEAMLRWLQTTVVVLQSAATSKDFLHHVARAVVDVGLDNGAVLMRADGGWLAKAFYSESATVEGIRWRPSQQILTAVCEQMRTVWHEPQPPGPDPSSLLGVESVVVAPIMGGSGEVIGVVYGDRRLGTSRHGPVSRVKAMLVELLACGVAAGFARLEQERAALAARLRFEQFFTPELSRELEAQPDLLAGKDAEVTLLVVDIRGFSRISERLGPAKTVDWIRDVMIALSDCVLMHQGVLVDYVGDEIMAMWGAPKEQPDHASRACRAGLDMQRELPRLNERWRAQLGEPLEIGIGINSGVARVGNVGSDRKFKYGPLGNSVNVASRVQGATKYLKSRLVITGATQARLGPEFQWRRLCRARAVNIAEPVELYELAAIGQAEFAGVQGFYEKALDEFEHGRFEEAARLLGQVLSQKANDGPSLVLMSRILDCLIEGPSKFDAAWTLPGK